MEIRFRQVETVMQLAIAKPLAWLVYGACLFLASLAETLGSSWRSADRKG